MEYATVMRIRLASALGDILVLVRRPMRDGTPSIGEAIENLSIRCNGEPLANVYVRENAVDNPFFTIAVGKLHAGDAVDAYWHDDRGNSGKARAIAR
jgi:hypothetical protein